MIRSLDNGEPGAMICVKWYGKCKISAILPPLYCVNVSMHTLKMAICRMNVVVLQNGEHYKRKTCSYFNVVWGKRTFCFPFLTLYGMTCLLWSFWKVMYSPKGFRCVFWFTCRYNKESTQDIVCHDMSAVTFPESTRIAVRVPLGLLFYMQVNKRHIYGELCG